MEFNTELQIETTFGVFELTRGEHPWVFILKRGSNWFAYWLSAGSEQLYEYPNIGEGVFFTNRTPDGTRLCHRVIEEKERIAIATFLWERAGKPFSREDRQRTESK